MCSAHAQSPLTIDKSLTVEFTWYKMRMNCQKSTLLEKWYSTKALPLAVLFVVHLSRFLNVYYTVPLQMANTSLLNSSPDGSLAILAVKMLAK